MTFLICSAFLKHEIKDGLKQLGKTQVVFRAL